MILYKGKDLWESTDEDNELVKLYEYSVHEGIVSHSSHSPIGKFQDDSSNLTDGFRLTMYNLTLKDSGNYVCGFHVKSVQYTSRVALDVIRMYFMLSWSHNPVWKVLHKINVL